MNRQEEFLKELKILGYSKHTINNYRCDLNLLGDFEYEVLKNVVLDTLGNIDNPRSRSRSLSCYKSFSRWLYDNDYTPKDYLKGIRSVKIPKTIPVIQEVNIDNVHAKPYYKTIIDTLYQTGMRISELSGLRLEDIKEGEILVRGKGQKERLIPVDKELLDRIKKVLEKHNFLSTSQIYKVVKEYARCNPHNLRHLFATRLAASGANGFQIMSLLGHSSITTSQVYVHMAKDGNLKKAVEKANA